MSLRSILHSSRSSRPRNRSTTAKNPAPTPVGRAGRRHGPGLAWLEALEGRRLLSFTPAVNYPVGTDPQEVVTADFNNDGKLDLATANAGSNTLSVLLGNGAGGFGATQQFPAGSSRAVDPLSLVAADFNNDGRPDLVTANDGSENQSILFGNGDGTFETGGLYNYGLSMAAGNFDGDANMDLVISGYDDLSYSGFIQVMLGNGQGGFTYPARYQLVDGLKSVLAVGDINGDGKLDAVMVIAGGNGWALIGNGDGTFLTPDPWYLGELSVGPGARDVALADFTGDGKLDVVVAGEDVNIMPGHGDGTFGPPGSHSASGNAQTGVAVADFDGDGKFDAVSTSDTGTVGLMLGNGDGTLRYDGAFAAGASPAAVTVGDFNGDGRPDVAAANGGSDTVSVLLNDGAWGPLPPPPPPPSVSVSDATTVTEGNTGTLNAIFTVTLSSPSTADVTVQYTTANLTAIAGSDYTAAFGTVTIPAGETSRTFTVPVKGDRLAEPTETFSVNLIDPTNAKIGDGQGIGTIVDDEPRISIGDVSRLEGKTGRTMQFTFTATLSAAYDQPVTTSFRTADGTARMSDRDYIAKAGTITFNPGETSRTITIDVRGDRRREANETFYVDLFGNSSNSLFTRSRGIGTILNDD